MATMEGFAGQERAGVRRARAAIWAALSRPLAWFAFAAAGLVIVFVGLGVDAWRHNNGADEAALLSLGNPGHIIAFVGLAMASVAVLAGLSVTALKDAASAPDAMRRFVPVTVAWVVVAVAGIGSLTYIAATGVSIGHSHSATPSAAAGTTGSEAVDIAQALQQQGISTDAGAAGPSAPGALPQGGTGANSAPHDMGKQPTFSQIDTLSDSQLLPLFPANTVTAADLPELKQQIEAVAAVAKKYPTTEAAAAAGYVQTTSDVPYMGEHWLNYNYVRTGVFDPNKPQGLLFSKVDDGPKKLVGVWFLLVPGINGIKRDVQPAGFASSLDMWHAHEGLCLVGVSGASESETKESCQAKGGNFTADLRWMLHVWVAPGFDNPDGVLTYLNADLFQKQQAAAKAAAQKTGNVSQ